MRGLWAYTVWLQERRRVTSQLMLCNRLSASLATRGAGAQVVNSDVVQTQEGFTRHNADSKNKSFMYTIAGFGAGIIISAILKAHYDEWTKSKKPLFHILPSISAASPFSVNPALDVNNNETQPATTLSKRISHNFIADAVEKASDKVVYIDIRDHRRSPIMRGGAQSLSNGSGFIVSEDGLILTNAHVVTNRPRSSTIMVRLHDGSECEGVVEDIDAISDLALIRVKRSKLSPAPLGKSSDLRPGEFVAALGSPLSLCNTVTAGVVSSVGRASKELGLRGRDIHYIQTDAAITFGNSGGPLINMDGEVIGINSMTVTSGISFAIPIDYAKDFIARAEKKRAELAKYPEPQGPDRRRYLGITMLTLTPSIIQELQSRGSVPQHIPPDLAHGILIWKIVVGSPAYQAGLQPGDIITHINNHEVQSSRAVYKFLEGRGELNMTVLRNGQRYFVSVVPEE
ncbi:serine protease HTRA2, mitochondrial-like isoform X2 [Eriocheir sinensis]|uniref:serine protease HTRA2, mitochondrial-like isoform X2 n=1 Tax=Eriocheir sinensis TaxID=95602 RepID=UPI0021C8C0A0|nr:serine protease HTRA2, mitochondrial-like isoform X2 [Eriocheir sinensis]